MALQQLLDVHKDDSLYIYNFYADFKDYKSEQRNIVKLDYPDGKFTYHIEFIYTFIKNKKLFGSEEHATIKIFDKLPFYNMQDAELYSKIAICGSEPIKGLPGEFTDRFYMHTIYDKTLKDIVGNNLEYAFDVLNNKPAYGIYRTNKYNKRSFEECINNLTNKHRQHFYTGDIKIVKTVNVHDLLNITSDEEDDLVDDLESCKNERNILVIKEIERTRKYLKFLKTLLK